MAKDKTKAKKGFTIIEVVLVLAIAGLIFLMVFVAFPTLQKNRNDAQRRQDYSDLASNIITQAGNTNGRWFTTQQINGENVRLYVNSTGQDPNGVQYEITVSELPEEVPASLEPGDINVYYGGVVCGDDGITPDNEVDGVEAIPRSFVVYGYMETGSGRYCIANEY